MKKLMFTVLFIMPFFMVGQSKAIVIDTLTMNEAVQYPVIRTGSSRVDSLINNDLINNIFFNEVRDLSIKERLEEEIEYGLSELNFKITNNNDNLLSITFFVEGCGAYCTSDYKFLNYSLNTGEALTIDDLLDNETSKKIKLALEENFKEEIEAELKSIKNDTTMDEDMTDWVIDYYQEAIQNISLNNFQIYQDKLVFRHRTYLPNVVKCFDVFSEMEYPIKIENIISK